MVQDEKVKARLEPVPKSIEPQRFSGKAKLYDSILLSVKRASELSPQELMSATLTHFITCGTVSGAFYRNPLKIKTTFTFFLLFSVVSVSHKCMVLKDVFIVRFQL